MEKETVALKKENLILKVVCGAMLVAGVGLYIYAYLQKDFALAKHEEALTATVKLKECESEVTKERNLASLAETEIWNQKQLANECYEKLMEAKNKKK
ncbi:MAG: hypothetical protein ACOVMQ_04070 [Cyclobacteriaceae bacterium]|jgi:hypothetical protein